MPDNRPSTYPRLIRPVPEPLALYLRPARNDHQQLLDLIAADDASCFGAVFDPTHLKRHEELRKQVLERRLDAVLDPRTQPAATAGGYTDALGALPWGAGRPHVPDDFRGTRGRRIAAGIAEFAVNNGFTQVLTPTHLLRSTDDDWLQVDIDSTWRLRDNLDRRGGTNIPIIYSLAVHYAMFRDQDQRQEIITERLKGLPISALWLKVDGFGATSTATAARIYLDAAAELQELGFPVVADHVGGLIGLSLMAFGAAGGIAHGITLGERFDATYWRSPRSNGKRSMPHRVYIREVDLMLKRHEAEVLFAASPKAKSLFGCKDTYCCPRGIRDMLEKPARHFLYQRIKDVSALGRVPEQLRAQHFLERYLRPATDLALAAANVNWNDNTMVKKTRAHRKRIDMLRIVLGNYIEKVSSPSFALRPKTRVAREARP